MIPVGSIITIRLARDNVDLKDMPEHTTLVSQTFWNTNDDPYDLRKDYNVKINEEEDLTTITLKPPQPQPSTVFKTNANKYNDKVTVESHINHVTADPLPSDPTWFSQFEVVKISFKGNYGETGYKIDSVQNAIHCGEDYYQANGAECIINISEVSDYKLRILKSAPGATAEECGVYDMEVQNKKYPDGAILSLNKIIRIIPQENFIIDQDRLADLELVDSNMSSYKVTGINPTVATKVAPFVTVTNENPDQIVIRTTKYPQITLSTYPDNTSIHVNEEFTIKFKNAADVPKYNVILSGAEFVSGTKYKAISTNVTIRAELKPIPATLHVVGEDANVDITAINDGRVLHDGDASLVVNDRIKIVPKYGYKLKDGHITGGEELDAVNHIYKITESSVTVEVEAIPFATIDNQSPTILFVKTIVGASVELSTFPNSDTIHVDEEFAVGFKLASNKDKYNLIITEATQIAGNIYKATTNNIVVKAESKFPPATIHIIDGDHVDVADAMSGRVILDNDTSLFVGDKITVIPKSGYRLKQKVGLELLSKPSKLYKIANASVTIEVEEIPTPPAPPPGSTHNAILWYLKSFFFDGV